MVDISDGWALPETYTQQDETTTSGFGSGGGSLWRGGLVLVGEPIAAQGAAWRVNGTDQQTSLSLWRICFRLVDGPANPFFLNMVNMEAAALVAARLGGFSEAGQQRIPSPWTNLLFGLWHLLLFLTS